MPKDGACNLGSMNLSEFVVNPYTNKAYFDFKSFKKATKIAIKALDEVIDYGYKYHALQSQRDMAYNYRNIGLGIMGLGSMFFKLGLIYGSKESLSLIDDIMKQMFRSAIFSSNDLAQKKGAFPKFSEKIFESTIIKNHFTQEEIRMMKRYGLRNCSLLSIAPSGSIGTMLNVTTGAEPAFRISYRRKTESLHKDKDVYYEVYIQEAEEYKKLHDTNVLPNYFISSEDIKYTDRVKMQSVIQKHVDTAISSTVNLPNETTIEDVEHLYLIAWENGLKGITIYRDGCKRDGILSDKKETKQEHSNQLKRGEWKPKAKDTVYFNRKISIGCGKLKLMIGWSNEEQKIQDMYVIRSGQGGCEKNLQGLVIAMSGMLRLGGNIFNIEKAFEGVGGCNSFVYQRAKGTKLSKGGSCNSAILNEIKVFLKEMKHTTKSIKVKDTIDNKSIKNESVFTKEELEYKQKHGDDTFAKHFNKCPLCAEPLQNSGGCKNCICGYSKCE